MTDDLVTRVAQWLPRARWFAGRREPAAVVTLADVADEAGPGVRLALVDAADDGGLRRYVLPVDAGTGADAACGPAFASWLLETVRGGHTLASAAGTFVGHPVGPAADAPPRGGVAPLGGDASNTSFLVGEGQRAVVVKLLRRCRAGIHPEVEVGEFLARGPGRDIAPPLCGWLEYRPAAGPAAAIATVHAFAPGRISAWDLLAGLVSDGGLAGSHGPRIRAVATLLGRHTAALHAALAAGTDLADFAPIAAGAEWRRQAADRYAARAAEACDLAGRRAAGLPPRVAARVAAIAVAKDRLVARLRDPDPLAGVPRLIRIHGDYHLGQVLVRGDGAAPLVIDFEGEPGRPLAERRAKAPAAQDVAGMCRSFDYLLRHAARGGGPASRAADRNSLVGAFLEAYAAAASGAAWWSADPEAARRLVAVFALDKALYELAYELDHRPDWVEVPLAAIEEALAAPDAQG